MVGKTSSDGSISVKDLAEGARRIAIQGRSVVADIRPNPTLGVFLALDRNVGTLILETGQDDARIFVDNRPYRRVTEHGIARIQVSVGEHTVRVERDGYRSPGPQRVEVAKNEERQVKLPLTPLPGVLEIVNARPGADVKVDGNSVGQVNSGGRLRAELAPGVRQVELSLSDYAPARFSAQVAPGKTVRPPASELAMSRITPPANLQPQAQADRVRIENQDWDRVRNSTNSADVDSFLRNYPNGTHTDAARDLAARLRQQEQQAQEGPPAPPTRTRGTPRTRTVNLPSRITSNASGTAPM